MNEEIAVRNLREVKEIFDKHRIRYWLDTGTLLGAVRDGKIIEWDTDIDLATMSDSWEKIVSAIPELLNRGFGVALDNLKICDNLFKQSIHIVRAGYIIDITLFQAKGGYALYGGIVPTNRISSYLHALYRLLITQGSPTLLSMKSKAAHKLCCLLPFQLRKSVSRVVRLMYTASGSKLYQWVIPMHYFERLGSIKFYEMTFNIPSDAEDYLKYRYGEDWDTLKRGWIFGEDDGAVRILKRPLNLIRMLLR